MNDCVVIGGGIVGLATAHALLRRFPGKHVVLIEKENRLAAHQTGRNSGVIHSGIYYKPGSFKAQFCKAGHKSMVTFCREHGIPYQLCGKVIVATETDELPRLEALYKRGIENELEVRKLTLAQMTELEPQIAGLAGLHVPCTGIVDYKAVVEKLADLVRSGGGEIKLGTRVLKAGDGVVCTTAGEFQTKTLINCAGLHSDRVARAAGADSSAKIVPFRGEYYKLKPEKARLVNGLIYPVPNPLFPFLGVHCTKMIDGSVHLGPNAVLAFAREGYCKTTVNARDLGEMLSFPGFWKMAARHWRDGFKEMARSFSRAQFVRSLQRLVPAITENDIVPCEAGVRAQALHRNGALEDDFLIIEKQGAIHVCNAPSPAATASLEIGRTIAEMINN
jgi:L-2-hydroxyglutarate oxidase